MSSIHKKIYLFIFFLKELIVANIQVALWVFKSKKDLKPAIIQYPLSCKTDQQILLLTSLITLTPGTLSLEVSPDRKNLWFHCLHTESPDQVVQSLKMGFEKMIMEAFP